MALPRIAVLDVFYVYVPCFDFSGASQAVFAVVLGKFKAEIIKSNEKDDTVEEPPAMN